MGRTKRILGAALLAVCAICLASVSQLASSSLAGSQAQPPSTEPVPAYHASAPTATLPATLSPSLFTDPVAQNAYSIAPRIKRVLFQQPCYCHCDRSQGHGSLYDCFTGQHAAECGVCTREAFYAYEQSRKGKTPAEIREGIERGGYRSMDITKYQKYENPPAKPGK